MTEMSDAEVMAPPREMTDAEVMTPPRQPRGPSPPIAALEDAGQPQPAPDATPAPLGAMSPEMVRIHDAAAALSGQRATIGPVLQAFGQGFDEGFDRSPIFSQQAVSYLRNAGILKEDDPFEAAKSYMAFTVFTAPSTVQLLFRGANAAFTGAQAALVQAGVPRDIAALPEAFMGSPHPMGVPRVVPLTEGALPGIKISEGAPQAGIRNFKIMQDGDHVADLQTSEAAPGHVVLESITSTEGTPHTLGPAAMRGTLREFLAQNPDTQFITADRGSGARGATGGGPERITFAVDGDRLRLVRADPDIAPDPAAVPPAIAEARTLGVIGPPKPDVAGMAPAAAAEAQVPRPRVAAAAQPQDMIRGPTPAGPEKAGNIRLDQIGINADAKDVILDVARTNDDFNAARAGNVPLAQVESLADASGVPSKVLTGNDGLGRLMHNDAVVRTWLQAFHQATDEIAEQMRTVARTGDEADIAKLREMKLRFQHMQEQVSGLTAEAGRTLRVFRDFYESKGKAEALGKLLEENPGNDVDSLKKLADIGRGLNDPAAVAKLLNDSRQPTFWDKYLYYWVNALISGPVTHLKYIGANAAFGAYEAGVVTPIAGALGMARRAVTGGAEGVYVGEAAARAWGLLAGTPDALRGAWTAARNNVMTPLPGEAVVKGANPLTQVRASPIGGTLGTVIGLPGRSAAGIHSFFRFLGFRAEIEAQAYRAAAKEGLSPLDGDAFWQRRAWHAANPTEAAFNAGADNGNHLTFIGEMGTFGQAVSRLANTRMGPGGMQPFKLILPFTHIPGQILRAGLEQTPAAFLDTKMRADLLGQNGAVAADTARARLVAGGLVGGMMVNWAINDVATGYGPTDPSERARWLRTHEPYSVRIGGWWVSYNKLGPLGDLMGLVGNLVEVGPKVKDAEYSQAAGHVIKATSRILEDEVGMQGLVNLLDAMDDPDRKMGRFLSGQAASNLPYSSMLRQTASFQDPYMREAKTFIDQLRYATPWSRQDLLPKRDWLGAPMDNPGYHAILRQRAVNTDPIDLEIGQMSIKPGPPLPRVGGVALPPKLYDEYQTLAGGLTRASLERIVSAPGWSEMPPYIREQIMHGTIESMRRTAGAMLQARHPELIEQGVQDRRDKINGVKPTKLQDAP